MGLAHIFQFIITYPFYLLRLEIRRRIITRKIRQWFAENVESEDLTTWNVLMGELNWVVEEERRLGLNKYEKGAS